MYTFGSLSRSKLDRVKPELRRVVEKALTLSEVDFSVIEGLRSKSRQRELFESGKSKTLRSRHITGHAVDIAPWVNGSIDWDNFDDFVKVAEAMRKAALYYNTEIVWGAAWLMAINYYSSAKASMNDYVNIRKAEGVKPFIDGPHFQLSWRNYP